MLTRRRALLVWVIGWLVAGIAAVCTLAPTARADDLSDYYSRHALYVCQDIINKPDRATVNEIVDAIQGAGFSNAQASAIVWAAVRNFCPDYIDLLNRVVAQNGRQQLA